LPTLPVGATTEKLIRRTGCCDDAGIADRIYLTIRPSTGEPLSQKQLANLSHVAHAATAEICTDGSARLGFAADRYSVETARGNLEMAARIELGAHWRTRYDIAAIPI
jgi:hypothetical protein